MTKANIEMRKEAILDHFNARIERWYENAKADYGVVGHGEARFNGDWFEVAYEENGKRFLAKMFIYDEYLIDNKIDWLFNVWSELSTGLEIVELN